MLATVDGYTIFKFLHVVLAVVWVGGAIMLQVLAQFALRSKLPGRTAEFARETEWVGTRIFTPASILVLLIGIWLVYDGNWGFGHFWIIAGFVSFVLSFVIGAGFLGPESGRLAKEIEAQGADSPAVKARISRILNIARIDMVVLVFIIFLMVTKIGQ
ncbi:MAG: DUF2269 domain-containing protein [Actinomycetota bacterium]|nr:DUF2269 domain-containing protein [Actinomycetota bacterium]